jgi:hypothetical protein
MVANKDNLIRVYSRSIRGFGEYERFDQPRMDTNGRE